jgi:hypothetical protein
MTEQIVMPKGPAVIRQDKFVKVDGLLATGKTAPNEVGEQVPVYKMSGKIKTTTWYDDGTVKETEEILDQ